MLKLRRTDWRALQWTGDDASEPKQLELRFSSTMPSMPQKHEKRRKHYH
jgi:hypothetical protein